MKSLSTLKGIKRIEKPLTWGDIVIVMKHAPKKYFPSNTGSICGIRLVDTVQDTEEYDCSIGDNLYLVEFPDGNSVEIPGKFLSKFML